MADYASTCLVFERNGDKLFPVRFRKEWIGTGANRRFVVMDIKTIAWQDLPNKAAAYDFTSNTMKIKAPTRAELIADGTIKPAGTDWPHGCLTLYP